MAALQRASAQVAASQMAAAAAGGCGGGGSPAQAPSAAAMAAADQTGKLAPVFAMPGSTGGSLAHVMPTVARPDALATAFHDGDLAAVDPVAAAQLDKALAPSGVPSSWYMSAADASARKTEQLLLSMQLEGNPDASLADILRAGPAMLTTKDQVKAALAASAQLSMQLVPGVPERFIYRGDLLRTPPPLPVMSPLAAESQLTPGQENYLLSLQCGAGQQQTAAMLP